MEPTIKTLVQKLYAHQIEGVMFHTLVSNTYAMLGDFKNMVKKHNVQALEELKNHLCFSDYMNCKNGEAIQPSATSKPTILAKEVTERPSSKLDREMIHKNLVEAWIKWEEETQKLYEDALDHLQNCALLKRMHIDVKKELKKANLMLDRL